MQQMITGLAACQKTIEDLLRTVRSSNERIEELADKVKTLDNKVDTLSSASAADESSTDGRGKKRKRTKSSLLVQVSANLYFFRFSKMTDVA